MSRDEADRHRTTAVALQAKAIDTDAENHRLGQTLRDAQSRYGKQRVESKYIWIVLIV